METGEVILIAGRLLFSALAAFFAIMVWGKTRDPAWMLAVLGVLALYAETLYAVLGLAGISVPVLSIILPNVPPFFFITAFIVLVKRHHEREK
ncbi:MAG: hypothetical protein LBT11_03090 [Treponema sp.]|jgi:TctA family transporter|nr:hypothetical protein [Treponema sp.]